MPDHERREMGERRERVSASVVSWRGVGGIEVVDRTTEALRGMMTLKGDSEGSVSQWFARESRRLKPRLLKRSRPAPTDQGCRDLARVGGLRSSSCDLQSPGLLTTGRSSAESPSV